MTPHPTDLEVLGFHKRVDEEKAPPKQVEEEEDPSMMAKEDNPASSRSTHP